MAEIFNDEDQRILNLTQNTRERIVRDLLKDGKIPQDNYDREFLMKSLDGLDRQVLAKTKIKSDDAAAKNNANATAMVAEALKKVGTIRNIGRTENPQLPVVDLVPVEGETHIGVQTFELKDIMVDDA